MDKSIIAIVGIVVVAVLAIVVMIRNKKVAKRKEVINGLQVEFMNLASRAKKSEDAYLRETSDFLIYKAPSIKDAEQIKVGLLDILAKYRESGKIPNDDFYKKAFEILTK